MWTSRQNMSTCMVWTTGFREKVVGLKALQDCFKRPFANLLKNKILRYNRNTLAIINRDYDNDIENHKSSVSPVSFLKHFFAQTRAGLITSSILDLHVCLCA